MKVLLINSNRYKLPVPPMPFGLCCVAASVERAGYSVKVLDLCFSKNCKKDVEKSISQYQPDIIGISVRNIDTCATYQTLFLLNEVKEQVINPVKNAFKGPIVIGGPSVGISGSEMLSFFDLEFAIRGDGEIAMVNFIKSIEKKLPLENVDGLIWRENEELRVDNAPLRIENLDSLPFTRHHHFIDIKPYLKFNSPIQIQTKRGCSQKCVYCTYNTIEGHHVRPKNPERIADEIELIVKETGVKHIEFTDSNFNIPLDHSKAVLRAIAKKNLDLTLHTMGLNPGAVDEELVDLMVKANFKHIEVGVESGCNLTLKTLRKNFSKEQILKTSQLLHAKNLPVIWYVLTGAPGETKETLRETFETIQNAASGKDLVVIGNGIRMYKGSPISKIWQKENANKKLAADFFQPVAYNPKTISLDTLRRFNKRIAMQNPNFFFFDETQRMPIWALKLQTTLMQLLAPKKPWWKSFIFFNKFMESLGISYIRRLIFDSKNRDLLTLSHN
jgi:radical SAM superfamily enzyme YgiQ (UPF0313 family)